MGIASGSHVLKSIPKMHAEQGLIGMALGVAGGTMSLGVRWSRETETDLIKVLFFTNLNSSRAEILPNERALLRFEKGTNIGGSLLPRVKLTIAVLLGEMFNDSIETFGTNLVPKHTHVSIGLLCIGLECWQLS